MKKILITMLILLATTLVYNSCAKAEDNLNILSASGTARLNAEPDTAVFTIAVETENKTPAKSMEENTEKASKVVSEIKKLLGKDDSIKTTGFNITPVYDYDNKERKNYLKGYRVTNKVNVKTKKINEVGKFIDKAVSCGANRIESLNFIVEDKDKYSNILLKQAAEEAKQKASTTAKALGLYIKGVKRVSTDFSGENIYPRYFSSYDAMSAKGVMAESAPPPVEAGEITLNATVSVEFIVETCK